MVAAKLKTDGHHDIDKRGHYTASVESKGGKIAEFHVVHDTKGNIPVKKYKTNQKMVQLTGSHLTYASFASPQEDMGTVEIGYSYIDDDGNEEIYWFPAEEILDPDSGCSPDLGKRIPQRKGSEGMPIRIPIRDVFQKDAA